MRRDRPSHSDDATGVPSRGGAGMRRLAEYGCSACVSLGALVDRLRNVDPAHGEQGLVPRIQMPVVGGSRCSWQVVYFHLLEFDLPAISTDKGEVPEHVLAPVLTRAQIRPVEPAQFITEPAAVVVLSAQDSND